MANKTKENENVVEEVTTEKMVKVNIPRSRENNSDVFVSVNERTWLIKRGVDVEVPECVAEVLRHSEEAQEEAYRFEEGLNR